MVQHIKQNWHMAREPRRKHFFRYKHYWKKKKISCSNFFFQTTVSISEIRSRSENRITCGFAVEVITKCGGGNDEVFEDIIKVILQSGDRTVHFFFPVAVSL